MSDVSLMSLVIDSRRLTRMVMDGPALKVTMYERSSVLFPLRRLCRIHILGTPGSGLDSLIYCAEQQVPVAFFHYSGRLRCRLFPASGTPALVDQWLEHLQFDPQIIQLYSEWLLHQSLHMLSQIGVNAGANENRSKLLLETLRHYCLQRLGRDHLNSALDWLDGLLTFQLEELIARFGFVQKRGCEKLHHDLKSICDLWLLFAFTVHLRKHPDFRVTPKSMTNFYQQQSSHLEYESRRMLTQLVCRLEAIV